MSEFNLLSTVISSSSPSLNKVPDLPGRTHPPVSSEASETSIIVAAVLLTLLAAAVFYACYSQEIKHCWDNVFGASRRAQGAEDNEGDALVDVNAGQSSTVQYNSAGNTASFLNQRQSDENGSGTNRDDHHNTEDGSNTMAIS